MIKAVIFDMDGTLVDSEAINIKLWCDEMEKYGFERNAKIIHQIVGIDNRVAEKILYDYFGDKASLMKAGKMQAKKEYILKNGVTLKQGAKEILAYLKDKLPIALATSTPKERSIPTLEMAHIKDYFSYIITGNEVENGKPNPEIFLKVAKELQLNPEDIMVVEDSKNGIKAAKNGGFISVLIPDVVAVDAEMNSCADYLFSSLNDLLDFLKNNA